MICFVRLHYLGKCLDIFGGSGPNIDEWDCKDPTSSDAANQQWYYNSTTQLFISKLDSSKCLTAVANKSSTFAYVYSSRNKTTEDNGYKVTFLLNIDSSNDYTVAWEGIDYYLPSESVSIIDSSGDELFNSGKVDTIDLPTERIYKTLYSGNDDLKFESWSEDIPLINNTQNRSDTAIYNKNPYEQIRFSNNTSEYLYYCASITTDFSTMNGKTLELKFEGQEANAYNVWFNNEFMGTDWNGAHSSGKMNFSVNIMNVTTNCGSSSSGSGSDCVLTILSSNLGIHNGISNQQGSDSQDKKGLTGRIWLYDSSDKKIVDEYSSAGWNHWIGSTGEVLNVSYFFLCVCVCVCDVFLFCLCFY